MERDSARTPTRLERITSFHGRPSLPVRRRSSARRMSSCTHAGQSVYMRGPNLMGRATLLLDQLLASSLVTSKFYLVDSVIVRDSILDISTDAKRRSANRGKPLLSCMFSHHNITKIAILKSIPCCPEPVLLLCCAVLKKTREHTNQVP